MQGKPRPSKAAPLIADVRREWAIASDISLIESLVADAVTLCISAGLSPRVCRLNVPVALTEAVSNAIMRGNNNDSQRRVLVSLVLNSSTLVIEVTDEGNGFDPATATFTPADANWLEREDGRGLFLMRSLMDSVELMRANAARGGHTVRLTLKRA